MTQRNTGSANMNAAATTFMARARFDAEDMVERFKIYINNCSISFERSHGGRLTRTSRFYEFKLELIFNKKNHETKR